MSEVEEEKETRRSAILIVDDQGIIDRYLDWESDESKRAYTNFTVWFEVITDYYNQGRFNTRYRLARYMERKLRGVEQLVVVVLAKGADESFEDWRMRALRHPVLSILTNGFMNAIVATKDNMVIN